MPANARQVGGDHYGSNDFKHWDWVLSIGLPYLEAHATKYLTRWDKKGQALPDLEKTLHFIEKIKENAALCGMLIRMTRPGTRWLGRETDRFLKTNSIWDGATGDAITLLASWEEVGDLDQAAMYVRQLIGRVKQRPDGDFMRAEKLETRVADAEPVPLSDSNKHAERSNT